MLVESPTAQEQLHCNHCLGYVCTYQDVEIVLQVSMLVTIVTEPRNSSAVYTRHIIGLMFTIIFITDTLMWKHDIKLGCALPIPTFATPVMINLPWIYLQ